MSKRARRRKPSSFQRVLADVARRNGLDPADCAHLERWRHDERWDDLWTAILIEIHKQPHGQVPAEIADEFAERILAPFFVREVLAIRHQAEQVDDQPNYGARADEADSLAKFLRRLPPPVPTIPNGLELASRLEEAALIMRAQADRSRMRVSREGRGHGGLQQQGVFVRQIRDLLQGMCGRPFREAVRVLTEIAYDREVLPDQVDSALKLGRR